MVSVFLGVYAKIYALFVVLSRVSAPGIVVFGACAEFKIGVAASKADRSAYSVTIKIDKEETAW